MTSTAAKPNTDEGCCRPSLVLLQNNICDRIETVSLEDGVSVRARITGPVNAPVLLVLGGISAHCNVSDPGTGWWANCAGEGKAIDLRHFRILSFDFLPGENPKNNQAKLSKVTPFDQARAALAVCRHFEISQLHAFVGASYGGMVALSFSVLYPGFAKQLIVLSTAHKPNPQGTAWRSIQRKLIRFGLETGCPQKGLALARELGMTTYRTPEEFAGRFAEGGVEDYLTYQGEKLIGKISPARYATLLQSIDLHNVNPADVADPVTLIACRQDRLVPPEEIRGLRVQLSNVQNYLEFDSIYGHDAFLKETAIVEAALTKALQENN